MKNSLIVLISCIASLLITYKALAQNAVYAGLNGSLVAPVIMNQNNYGQRELPYEVFLSGNFGVQIGFETSLNSAVQIEINYTNNGQSYAGSNSQGTLKKDLRLQYIQVPVWYKFNFLKDTIINRTGSKWYGAAGVFAGFLLNADMLLSRNGTNSDFYSFTLSDIENINSGRLNALLPNGGNPDYKSLFNNFDFGLGLALGVDIFLSPKSKLNIELRGLMGIPDINSEDWQLPNRGNIYEASRTLNSGLNVGLSFYLN